MKDRIDYSDPAPVEIGGQPLRCHVCGHDSFRHRRAQLHGGVATFFNVEWASPTADCYVCGVCGYVHSFLAPKA